MQKVKIRYASPRKFRVRYREEGANDVTIITTFSGTFSFHLAGDGDIVINWGDGVTEDVSLTVAPSTYTHDYAAGGTITLRNAAGLTYLYAPSMEITWCDIRATCTAIAAIILPDNNLSVFHTYATWVNMWGLSLSINNLTSIDLFSTWVGMNYLDIYSNNLMSIDVPEEWVDIKYIDLYNNGLTSFTTYASWVDLDDLYLENNNLTSIILHAEWTSIENILLSNNVLTTLIVHSEWVDLIDFEAQANRLNVTAVNHIMTEFEPVISGAGDILWLDQDTNAAPTGAGLVAANNMLATGADVRWNGAGVTFDSVAITWDSVAVTFDNM